MGYSKIQNCKVPVLERGDHYVTSSYGYRIHPITREWSGHRGVDLVGSPAVDYIIAPTDGKITYVKDNHSTAGTYVVLYHANKTYSRYLHLQERYVNKGDIVKKGQRLGLMGTTGASTGNHLHFEVIHNANSYGEKGDYDDPVYYITGERGFTNNGNPISTPNEDSPTPPSTPPIITNIIQLSSTKVQIEGNTNGGTYPNTYTICYYKFGNNMDTNISNGDFYGKVSGVRDFKIIIDKPREATYISVIPVQINEDIGDSEAHGGLQGQVKEQPLQESYPCVQMTNSDNELVDTIPYIYDKGIWKQAIPTIRKNNSWIELYNTDSEKL